MEGRRSYPSRKKRSYRYEREKITPLQKEEDESAIEGSGSYCNRKEKEDDLTVTERNFQSQLQACLDTRTFIFECS
jgi:hypothetical protein